MWYWHGFGGHQVRVLCQALQGMELPANSMRLSKTALSASGRALWDGKASSSGNPGAWWTHRWSLIPSVLILGSSCPPAPRQSCALGGGSSARQPQSCPRLRLCGQEENKDDGCCRLQRAWHKGIPARQGAAAGGWAKGAARTVQVKWPGTTLARNHALGLPAGHINSSEKANKIIGKGKCLSIW